MAKDRARPFSRKHRKYWITVTGGMLLIGLFNVAIGMCGYEPPRTPERIIPVLPPAWTPAPSTDGTIGLGEIPTAVIRAFANAYPRHVPSARRLLAGAATVYELTYTDAGKTTHVIYKPDGGVIGVR
ncbi:MAG: hypothetical protein IPQ07_19975 [Myxococcales bacterium]|nr:hypothetical protein [Myxococcales bacterium]